MLKLLHLISALIICGSATSQIANITLTKSGIDSLVISKDSSLKVEKGLFIIDGLHYNGIKLDSILKTISKDDLSEIRLFKNREISWGHNPDGWIIIVSSKYQQKRKIIRSNLKKAKKLFSNDSIPGVALYIDDILVENDDLKKDSLKNLNSKQIFFIDIMTEKITGGKLLYGKNYENGVVKVYLKSK